MEQYTHHIPYFMTLPEREHHLIAAQSQLYTFSAGQVIFVEGETAQGLWVVQQGSVKIFKLSAEGNEHILHLRGPGRTFNDIAALDGRPNPANATALIADTQVWLIPVATIEAVLLRNPAVALHVIRLLAVRVRGLVGQIEDLALYSVVVRLARFLLRQSEDPSLSGPGITRTAIAAHINTTPQTVSVLLRELESAGAIEFDRHRIVITSEDTLRSVALL